MGEDLRIPTHFTPALRGRATMDRMQRRHLIAALAGGLAAGARAAEPAQPRPRQRISAATLHEALSARFPLRLGVGQLVELTVTAPALHLLPARNRLGAGLRAQLGGPALGAAGSGEIDVLFALRYERADRSVRARDAEIAGMRWPGLPREAVQSVQPVATALLRELGEVTLHRFSAQELALPDTMGFEPEELRVVEDGVVVFFGPKR